MYYTLINEIDTPLWYVALGLQIWSFDYTKTDTKMEDTFSHVSDVNYILVMTQIHSRTEDRFLCFLKILPPVLL